MLRLTNMWFLLLTCISVFSNKYMFVINFFYHLFKTSLAPPIQELTQPCNPSPCGANTVCKERNNVGSCSCLPEYFGDPYVGCKPECVTNSDCNRDRACIQNKCKDPCPGLCGPNAICKTHNHNPSCYCREGFTGDPLRVCHEIRKPLCKNRKSTKSSKSLK